MMSTVQINGKLRMAIPAQISPIKQVSDASLPLQACSPPFRARAARPLQLPPPVDLGYRDRPNKPVPTPAAVSSQLSDTQGQTRVGNGTHANTDRCSENP